MKTMHLHHWLRYAVVLLTALTGSLPMMAQEDEVEGGEAFYIYQNDGHFDGFFYDQVKEIRYSRYDTLGIERSEYVSQEIVTEDSVYRIMLTAIDSVSYVQPEIRYAKGMRFMRDEGLMDYYVSMTQTDDGFLLQFDGALPAALQPKKNEVLSCPDLPDSEDAFVGKVKAVRNEGGKLIVECGYVEKLSEVFDQFITVEQVKNIQTADGSRTRRRIAGINAPKRAEGNVSDLTLFSFNYTFEGKMTLYDKLKLQVLLNTGFGMTLTASYKITWSEFYIKTLIKSQMSVGGTLALDGELYDNGDLTALPGIGAFVEKFSKIPFPANFPILFIDMVPKPFARAEAHLNVGVTVGAQVKASSLMLEVKDKWPYVDMGLNFIAPFLPYSVDPVEKGISINAQINGNMQSGLKFPIKANTLPWIKKCCFVETGATIYAGPKVSGVLNFDILKTGKGVYEALKDSKVDLATISVDTEIEGEATVLGKEWKTKRTKSWAYGNFTFTLFPSFSNLSYTLAGENEDEIKCRCDIEGLTCLPEKVGIGVYCKANDNDKEFTELYDSFYMDGDYWYKDNFNSVEGGFTKMDPGEYRLRPIIAFPGVESLKSLIVPVYNEEKAVVIEEQELNLDPVEGTFEESGGEMEVTLLNKLSRPITAECDANWIKTEITLPDGKGGYGKMKVKVDENNTDAFRTATITVRQRYSTTHYSEKTFTVKQYGGLQLSPKQLSFGKDGGGQTIEILTSMRPITINLNGNDDWISYDLDGNKLTIIVKPNSGAPRKADITISAWSSKHNGINTVKLTVTQEGEDTSVPHISPTSLSFSAKGGTQKVNAYLGTTYNRIGNRVEKDGTGWITAENNEYNDGFYVNITAKPNTTGAKRTGTVSIFMAAFEGDSPAPGTPMKTFTVTVTQEGGPVSVNSCAFTASATMREKTTGGISTKNYGETFTSPNVSVTLSGTKLHVVATKNYKEGEYDEYQNVMEFDITAIGDDFAGSKVENLTFRHVYSNTYVDYTSPGMYGKGDDVALQLTDLSWKEAESTYKEGEKSTIVFSGKVKDGVKFTKLTQKTYNYTDDKPTQEFSYVDNESNSARLVIELTVDRAALSALSTSRQTSD